jgi:uncharacterized delta-60 repeat protein
VAVQPDGKIVAVGHGIGTLELARYETDGDLDSTFDEDGRVITNGPGAGWALWSVAIQADGRIIVAGATGDVFTLVRYGPEGAIDGTLGDNGFVGPLLGDGSERGSDASAVALQADGRIVAGGTLVDEYGGNKVLVARFLSE